MIPEEILELDDDDRPPLLVIEEEDPAPESSRTAPETYQKPEELVGLEPKPTKEIDLSGRSMDEHTRIVDKAKRAQEEEDARARFMSPLKGPYET